MNALQPKLFSDLEFRGILKQVTDPTLSDALAKDSMTLYCGFDPTADSLHIGSLLPLMTLRRFQLAGHRPIAVVGGATGMIGDPSGKSQERTLLSDEQLQINLAGIRKNIASILDSSGKFGAKVVSNGDWFKDMSYLRFLRDVGKHFTVNHMIAKESVRARLEDREHGISYTEFSYMLLQAYDFLHLYQAEGCRLQIGGSDQWGNITAGIELIRRVKGHDAHTDVFGLTMPLVQKADGSKFGKSESGTIWMDAAKTSPYRLYQYLVQTPDSEAITFLKYFTLLTPERIQEIEHSLKTEPEKRLAQTTLAKEVTALLHGASELAKAEAATQALFGASIRELDEKTLLDVLSGAPSTEKPKSGLSSGLPLVDLLVDTTLCQSKGAARKDMAAGGIYINNERASDPALIVKADQLLCGKYLVLRKGKKTYHLVVLK